jgi:hypothetical protein
MARSIQKPSPICQAPVELIVPDDLIPEYLPGGGISILAGAPNLGKTAFLAGLLRDLQLGRPIFGRQPRRVPMGFVNADRGWKRGAGMWLKRAGVQPLPIYSLSDDPDHKPKTMRRKFDRVDMLLGFIDRLKLPPDSLIIVDPVSPFLGGNLLDYDTCMVACGELRAYLRDRQYTLLGTAHSGKLKADKRERYVRTSDQILGSTAIAGFTDAVLHLASPEELGKGYYALAWHPHGAKPETYLMDRDEQGLFVPWTGADVETLARVVSLFPDDGTTLAFGQLVERAEALPLSRRTVKNALDKLIEQGRVERVGHGEYRRVVLQ